MILPAGGSGDGWGRSLFGGGVVRPPEEAAGWRLGRGVWTDAVKGRGFVERTGHAAPDRMPRIDALRNGRYCR